jgi:(2Fe-2S) ferredoxin
MSIFGFVKTKKDLENKEGSTVMDVSELALKSPVTLAKLTHHVFVCTGKSCSANDGEATLQAFWDVLAEKGLLYGKRGTKEGRVVVTKCGSVGLCAVGPAVLIYPEGVWYYGVTPQDVPELVESHFVQGQILERLLAMRLGES